MVIMGTNIGPEPICTNMRLSIRTTKTVSQYPYDLNVPDVQGAVSKARSLVWWGGTHNDWQQPGFRVLHVSIYIIIYNLLLTQRDY